MECLTGACDNVLGDQFSSSKWAVQFWPSRNFCVYTNGNLCVEDINKSNINKMSCPPMGFAYIQHKAHDMALNYL